MAVEEVEEFRTSAAPIAEEEQRTLRKLQRDAVGARAESDALRSRHEQARLAHPSP